MARGSGPRTTTGRILLLGLVCVAILATIGSSGVSANPGDQSADIDGNPIPTVETGIRGLSVSTGEDEVVKGVGDILTVSGSGAEGGSVRVYAVGPRGRVLDTDGENPKGTSISGDGSFEADFSVFDRGGTYIFIAVAPGEDETFEHGADTGTQEANTQQQNVELIRSAYLGPAGSDDQVAQMEITTVKPDVTIDSPSDDTEMKPGDLSVSGSANLPDGTLFVDLVDEDGDVAVSDNTTMSDGSWSMTMDLSEVDPGHYTVYAHNVSAGDRTEIWILTANGKRPSPLTLTPRPTYRRQTPTERYTFVDPGTELVTRTVVQTVEKTVVRTVVRTQNGTTKSAGLDGFGPAIALLSVSLALVLALRRSRFSV